MSGKKGVHANKALQAYKKFFVVPAVLMLAFFIFISPFTAAANLLPIRNDDLSVRSNLPNPDKKSGAMIHTIDIDIPPGRAGLSPAVALTYNNQDRNDQNLVGYRWSLSIPSIARINRTGIIDLYDAELFTSSLDGELVKVSSTTYRPKVENGSFRQYQFSNDQWTVTEKDGIVHQFGHGTSTRQDDPDDSTHIFKWMIDETRDTNDNYITYTYYKNAGQIYPDTITYTGNGTTDGPFDIHFDRETRSDDVISYATGFGVTTNYRISEIRTEVNDSWQRKYELDYTTSSNGVRSLLSAVTESGKNESGATVTLPSTDFTYEAINKSWNVTGYNVPAEFNDSNGADLGVRLADINGDGLPDWLRSYGGPSTEILQVYLNEGDGFASSSSWSIPVPDTSYGYFVTYGWSGAGPDMGARLVDVNGDGLTDILWRYGTDINKAYINTGSGWTEDSRWLSPVVFIDTYYERPNGIRFMEVNGDGLIDIVHSDTNQNVFLNNGNGWTYDASISVPFTFGNYDYGHRLADVNGDGLTDVLYAEQDGSSTVHKETYLGTGSGWATTTDWEMP
ncbi:MAG: SpvB/TcaC N-terminal domain-containing protein, partial [Alphaproteobacteria bacterium]